MTDRIEDGGAAYPGVASFLQREHRRERDRFTYDVTTTGGMSLRDYFAGQALANPNIAEGTALMNAEWAYRQADAMLEIRARQMGVQTGEVGNE